MIFVGLLKVVCSSAVTRSSRVIGPMLWFSHTVSTPYEAFLTHSVCLRVPVRLSECVRLPVLPLTSHARYWNRLNECETNRRPHPSGDHFYRNQQKQNAHFWFCRIDRLNNTVAALSDPKEGRGVKRTWWHRRLSLPSLLVPGSNALRCGGVEFKFSTFHCFSFCWHHRSVLCFVFMLVLLHVLGLCCGLLCSTLLPWQETEESVSMNVCAASLLREARWQFPCFYFHFTGTNGIKRRMLAVWKINQSFFFFLWKTAWFSSLLFS